MEDCYSTLEQALEATLSDRLRVESIDEGCRITVPFYQPGGDAITLYVSKKDGRYSITDGGITHGTLLNSGAEIDTEKRERRLEAIAERYNLDDYEAQISVSASSNDLGDRLFDAIQASLSIGHLVYMKQKYSPSYFKDKVGAFLLANNFNVEEDEDVPGEDKDWRVDYSVKELSSPTYIETIQARTAYDLEEKCDDASYKWIKISRADDRARFYSVIDDIDGAFHKEKIRPLVTDSDAVIPWSERDDLLNALTA